ncbi:MAG: AAA family ATPase [Saprospiraceae bacterium]
MQLIELSYKSVHWELRDLKLKEVNLIVGKNSVGKSRTLATIGFLYNIITQKAKLNNKENWIIKFKKSNSILEYEISTYASRREVKHERILLNGEEVLKRRNGSLAEVKSIKTNKWTKLNPPKDRLILQTFRDVVEYPFFEDIVRWAENSFGFKFSNFDSFSNKPERYYGLSNSFRNAPFYFKNLSSKEQNQILLNLNSLGYNFTKLGVTYKQRTAKFYMKENGVPNIIFDHKFSQGVLRSLTILVYFEYMLKNEQPTTILIDDFCEGLDYERATKLGKIIFEKCKNSKVQLIATSNDSFLMDIVDIEYWNVLQREGQVVNAISQSTHPDLFEKFRFTGLSNFDFFASDFISQKL